MIFNSEFLDTFQLKLRNELQICFSYAFPIVHMQGSTRVAIFNVPLRHIARADDRRDIIDHVTDNSPGAIINFDDNGTGAPIMTILTMLKCYYI